MRTKGIPELKHQQRNVGAYPAMWARWEAAATREGKTRQQWIRDALTAAAERSERKAVRA